jgi:hypothetical protein
MNEIEILRSTLETNLHKFATEIGKVQIGNKTQFPYGWRNAAKGRTVWRILEEIVIQNLQFRASELGFDKVEFSTSEISVFDFRCKMTDTDIFVYVNIKSALLGGESNKDDLSKPQGLIDFFAENIDKNLFIATFFIIFNETEDISIQLSKVTVFPIAWIPDIYVNPSNNGNLQSSKYKDISNAVKRTNQEFVDLLKVEILNANEKKRNKNSKQ